MKQNQKISWFTTIKIQNCLLNTSPLTIKTWKKYPGLSIAAAEIILHGWPGVIKTYEIPKLLWNKRYCPLPLRPIFFQKSFCGCCTKENEFCSGDNGYRQSHKFPDTTYNSKIETVLKPVLYFADNKQF